MNTEEFQNQINNRIPLITKGQGAFLGAAIGDALGWPQELEAKRIDKNSFSVAEVLENGFQQWERKSGGQYYPHEEIIQAGEYSDDTQLILCTGRSLLYGNQWWHQLTKLELPIWTYYERGGGGATKRAAKSWLWEIEPWLSKDKKRYFDAGGNGAAMRILPHCIVGAKETSFAKIAKNIVANSVTTHGHPRALLGALAYGFAVWLALRQTNTLEYGAIIDKVFSEVNSWSLLPDLNDICPTWKNSALEVSYGKYDDNWKVTVKEMLQLLEKCQEGMKEGALSIEKEILTQLGCFNKSIKGAGTVSAAAAIFLASRFAANPFQGIIEAGFAEGSDTDTIASMTGGILGALAGIEWLRNYKNKVQDANYLKQLAEHLAKNQNRSQTKQADNRKVTKNTANLLIVNINKLNIGDNITFPDGRQANLSSIINHNSLSKSTIATSRKLLTADGQSLYFKKLSRLKNDPKANFQLKAVNVVNIGVKLLVRDMNVARFFYEKVLGLKVEKESKNAVRCGCIVLVPISPKENTLQSLNNSNQKNPERIYLEVASLDEVYSNVRQFEAKIVRDIYEREERRSFLCLDPDDNMVEILEIKF
ncbi:MAG: ADP-ribosylglycohydrolase family protein [Rivularia sp. (in: Bacteria)]|nr:ADP-ribosylglycohydrolase family protein [Rivularia sp. MS3]